MIIDPATYRLSKRPAFIVFEGVNGCGKTTLLENIATWFSGNGLPFRKTREPGGTPLGAELRRLLLDWSGEKITPQAELLLFAADRAEHIDKVVRPSLTSGVTVLCDRFIYSTLAFQGHGRGLARETIEAANSLAVRGTLPDLVILLDLDPAIALGRAAARRNDGKDSFEQEELAFHGRIRDGFLELAEAEAVPFLLLNAEKKPGQLAQEVARILHP